MSLKTLQDGKPVHNPFEIVLVLVGIHHVASVIVNANHSIMRVAVEFGVIDYIADRKRPRLFSPR